MTPHEGFELNKVTPVHRGGRRVKFSTVISVGRVAELLESQKIQVDYDYQRGIKVTYGKDGSEKRTPMVDRARVEEIARKILDNEIHGGSLTWNLRNGEVEAEYDEVTETLVIKSGTPTIPDSNHRHQGILLAINRARQFGLTFDQDGYEFPLVIEELDLQGESGLFHEYNQLGKPANPTRRRFINQASLHNAIAARVMEGSVLKNNVETVTNNLTRNTNKVMTFNTLASGVQQGFKTLDEMNFEDTRNFLITFVNELSAIRPEVGYLPISERLKIREATIGDSGLIFQAYLRLAGDLQNYPNWPEMLEQLGEPFITRDDDGKILYQGDLMSRQNPLWRQTVLVEGKNGRVSIANRTESREYAYRTLRDVVGIDN